MKKRFLPCLLLIVLVLGCASAGGQRYQGALFDANLPEGFAPVANAQVLCFAPHGDPVLSSSITCYTTESNWYFDRFTDDDYAQALCDAGYEIVAIEDVKPCKVDGFDARRISCQIEIDQITHTLIVYAVSADRTYFFTLLNQNGDDYVQPFDEMMQTVRLKGAQ